MNMFLTLNEKDKGYMLLSGTVIDRAELSTSFDRILRFTYRQEGSYYSMKIQNPAPELEDLIWILKFNDVKIKITPVNRYDYILSSPINTIMMCTDT